MSTIVRKKVSELKPHPYNEEIYGINESIDELVASIRKTGKVATLIITDDNVIISGHRRWKSCQRLVEEGDTRFNSVNCEIEQFVDSLDEIESLIMYNDTRIKSLEQKAREAQILIEIEKQKAEKRRLATQNNNSAEKVRQEIAEWAEPPSQVNGRPRDIVAKKLKMKSGREVERAVKSIETIDKLTETGRKDDAELIRDTLNNTSASTAADLSSHIDELTEEEKQAIRDKKMSAYKVISKYATKRIPNITDDMSEEEKAELEHKQSCKETVEEYIAQSLGLIDIPEIPVEDRTDDLIAFFNSSVSTFTAAITNLIGNAPNFSEEQFNRVFGIIKIAENKLSNLKNIMEV